MIPLLSATNREVGARLSLLRLPPDFEEAYASTPFAYQREETLKVPPASPEVSICWNSGHFTQNPHRRSMSVMALVTTAGSLVGGSILQSLRFPYASAAGRSVCHPAKARWKSRFVGTISDI